MLGMSVATYLRMVVHDCTPSNPEPQLWAFAGRIVASRNSLQLGQGLASKPRNLQPCSTHAMTVCGNISLWDCTPSTPLSHNCGLLWAAFVASRSSLQLSQGLPSEPRIMQPCSTDAKNVCGNISLWDCIPSTPQPQLWAFAGRICCVPQFTTTESGAAL